MMRAALEGRGTPEIVERDDGFFEASNFHETYMAPFRRWPAHNRRAMRFVRGRVLDVGCGAGRVCLHLQERGLDVVGIDISPGAVEVCRRRGVLDARVCRIEDVDATLGMFDTIVMLGNNFGLFASKTKARRTGADSTRSRPIADGSSPRRAISTTPRILTISAITSAIAVARAWRDRSGCACGTASSRRRGSTT